MAYTTIDNVQEFYGTTFTANTSPSLSQVTSYISDVDTEINNLTGTVFGTPVNKIDYVDSEAYNDLFLTEKYPIDTVNSVEVNKSTDVFDSDSWEALAFINDRFRIRTKRKVKGFRILKIDYDYGYSTVPPEVKHLATLLVVQKILSGEAIGDSATQSISVGPISLTNSVGVDRVINLSNEIKEFKRRVGRYKNFTR